MNKLLLKDRVLTAGSGPYRAVLCYDSKLVYQYDAPENILAVYDSGKWIMPKKPHYSRGSWGNSSSGDVEGGRLHENALNLLVSISASISRINSPKLLTQSEIRELKLKSNALKKLNKSLKKLSIDININQFDFKLEKISPYSSRKNPCPRGLDPFKTIDKINKSIEVFKNNRGKALKVLDYNVSKDLVKQGSIVVAFRDSQNQIFMNSQVLNVSQFERNFLGSQSIIQKEILKITDFSIPFNVLESASLGLKKTKVLERGPESTHVLINGIERHFTGALLLENNGRRFLMDIDRLEITHKIFNAFFVEVKSDVNTIVEAYESMIPDAVKLTQSEVKRQGEWFFIKTDKTITVPFHLDARYDRNTDALKNVPYTLISNISHGKGRPNQLLKPVNFGDLDQYVCGTVRHTGQEHKDLDLGCRENRDSQNNLESKTYDLWRVIPNTTVSNFTIKGDVD